MVCYCSIPKHLAQLDVEVFDPADTSFSPAKAMTPFQRRHLALEALAGSETISCLAGQHAVSRKFVYRQAAKAEAALDVAFSPSWKTGRVRPSPLRPILSVRKRGCNGGDELRKLWQ